MAVVSAKVESELMEMPKEEAQVKGEWGGGGCWPRGLLASAEARTLSSALPGCAQLTQGRLTASVLCRSGWRP